MTRRRYVRSYRDELLGGVLVAGFLVALALVAWPLTLTLLVGYVALWALARWHHGKQHMPGHRGDVGHCVFCRRHHAARYAELKAAEAERLRWADYQRLRATEPSTRSSERR